MTNATKHLLAAVSIVLAILVGEQAWTPTFCLNIWEHVFSASWWIHTVGLRGFQVKITYWADKNFEAIKKLSNSSFLTG